MDAMDPAEAKTDAVRPPVKLALLWASLMALYIYNDYFMLYWPGMIEMMASSSLGPFGAVTGLKMLLIAAILALPASMIFLSVLLPPMIARPLNIVVGLVYLIIAALTLIGSPLFFRFIVMIEITATVLVILTALTWRKA
ncbi:hypothetical protein HK107_00860 [Parvularcula sp. ZS-1/3]|uniref:Uncharacterized protein n=1 Tax=Parvularcula mediterranea TaxID=2732508 RepID=A0A7Y3W462_9PROT|nr:DUF6326 family protein [Parvularcula mediterranea]NNU14871.1 hypothetical protein [Parvularcula mediterranea]